MDVLIPVCLSYYGTMNVLFFVLFCSMEFLCRSTTGDGPPLVAFGGSDGVIRVLSMISWKVCGWLSCWYVVCNYSPLIVW